MELTIKPDTRGYCKVKPAAKYAGVSERTFRPWLKDGLRHIRLKSGTILISYQAIDEYLAAHEVNHNQVDDLVEEVLKDL